MSTLKKATSIRSNRAAKALTDDGCTSREVESYCTKNTRGEMKL
jgi:hypothetical protein